MKIILGYAELIINCYNGINKSFIELLNIGLRESFDDFSINKTKFEGRINCNEDEFLVLQIPYDEGWTGKINGEEINIDKAYGTFIGISTKKGENNIELKYFPKYLKEGIILSLISLMILVFLIVKKL